MKKIYFVVFAFIFSINSLAQNNSPLDGRNWGVVYDVPATKNVKVKADVPYSGALTIDIYSPPNAKANDKFPAVIFLNAIGDQPGQAKVKTWGIYSSFPRLVAAHNMVGISMEMDGTKIQESLRALFDFLEKEGAKHGIDGTRLGVYAASANVSQSTIYLMSETASRGIRAAVLYYGATPMPETKIRKDLPVLFVIAEGDMPRMRDSLPALWQRVAETGAPWTLQMGSGLPHAFDAFANTDESRRVIQQTIAFWKSNLEPVPQPAKDPNDGREILSAIYGNNSVKAAELLQKYVAANPNDTAALNSYGRILVDLRRFDEASVVYEKALSLGATEPGIYVGLGQFRMQQKRYEEAVTYLAKAIELGARNSLTYGQLGYAQMALNRNEDAIKTYEKAFEAGIPPGANTRGVAFYNMACAYARLKQTDKAFEMLNKAVDEGFANRPAYETDTDFASLRTDARFQKLLERLPKATN